MKNLSIYILRYVNLENAGRRSFVKRAAPSVAWTSTLLGGRRLQSTWATRGRTFLVVNLMRTRLAILLGLIGLLVSGLAAVFFWRAESLLAEVRRDDESLNIGQYLHLEQKLSEEEQGWTLMKIDLPEHWTVEEVAVDDGRIRVRTEGGVLYVLTKDNLGKMNFEILDGGNKSDEVLEKIWKKHALQPSA